MGRGENANGFTKRFRGYDADEVDELISKLKSDAVSLEEKCGDLEHRLESAEARLDKYVRAGVVCKDMIAEAKAESDRIVREANESAAEIVSRTESQCGRIVDDMVSKVAEQRGAYDAAKSEVAKFRDELFALYGAHIKKINAYVRAAGVESADDGALIDEKIDKIKKEAEAIPEDFAPPGQKDTADSLQKADDVDVPDENEHEDEPGADRAAFDIDDEDEDEFGDEGPLGNAVSEYDGTVSVDDVFGKASSYDDADFEAIYGGEASSKKPKPAKEEILNRRRMAEDDSNEFYAEGDDGYETPDDPDAPTAEIRVTKTLLTVPQKKKRWKIKRSMSITDEFKAAIAENEDD